MYIRLASTTPRFIYDVDGFRNVVYLIILGAGAGFSATLNIHETTGESQIKVQTGMFVHAFYVLKRSKGSILPFAGPASVAIWS